MSPAATLRRGHRFAVRSALQEGRVGWLLRAGSRALRLRLGRPTAPLFGTLAVTYRCNYRCSFCDLPGRARRDPTLAELVGRLELLRRKGALAVGITGGEPLLHPRLLEVIAAAREMGLLVHLNTNGSRLTAERAAPLLAAGLHSINVSLDGARPRTHDRLRGVPGSFAQIRATIAALRAGRRGRTPRIGLVMAITPRNLDEVLPFARLAQAWGADAAGWLPHHELSERRAPLAADAARRLAEELEQAAREVAICDNSPGYRRAAARPTPTSPSIRKGAATLACRS